MGEAVIDIVHRHDAGGGAGRLQRLERKPWSEFRQNRMGGGAFARRQGAGDEGAGALLFGEQSLLRQ